MANVFSTFPKASFHGIEFPYSRISIKGAVRHHVHEFPHSAGGDPEKMGRKLYEFSFRIPAHDLPGSELARSYPDLYPLRVIQLHEYWDKQITDDLVIPNVGTIKAFATNWVRVADMSDALSGESIDVDFLEDSDAAILAVDMPQFGVAAMVVANEELQTSAEDAGFKPSIFQEINDAVTAVDGILGQGDAYSRLVAAKIEAVADLCGRADRAVEELQNPMNHVVLEALKDVWANAVDLAATVPGVSTKVLVYRVPRLMSIGQVSTHLYGTSERGFELLQMNPIDDAFAIKAGTSIKYLSDAA